MKHVMPWITSEETTRYVTELDGEYYAIDYSFARGNEVFGPYATEDEAIDA